MTAKLINICYSPGRYKDKDCGEDCPFYKDCVYEDKEYKKEKKGGR